jgi:hypothetical protein
MVDLTFTSDVIPFPISTDGRVLDNVVLLHDGKDVTAKLSHLPVVFLDHPYPGRDIQGSGRLFKNSLPWAPLAAIRFSRSF